MTLVGGVFNTVVMTGKLTVLNNDIAVLLHALLSHAGDFRVSALLQHNFRNSPTH